MSDIILEVEGKRIRQLIIPKGGRVLELSVYYNTFDSESPDSKINSPLIIQAQPRITIKQVREDNLLVVYEITVQKNNKGRSVAVIQFSNTNSEGETKSLRLSVYQSSEVIPTWKDRELELVSGQTEVEPFTLEEYTDEGRNVIFTGACIPESKIAVNRLVSDYIEPNFEPVFNFERITWYQTDGVKVVGLLTDTDQLRDLSDYKYDYSYSKHEDTSGLRYSKHEDTSGLRYSKHEDTSGLRYEETDYNNNIILNRPINDHFDPRLYHFFTVWKSEFSDIPAEYLITATSTEYPLENPETGLPLNSDCAYTIAIRPSDHALGTADYDDFIYDNNEEIVSDLRYCGRIGLYYRNRLGALDTFLIEGNCIKSDSLEKTPYVTDFNNTNKTAFGKRQINGPITTTWTLNTGLLTDSESKTLVSELLSTPELYVHDLEEDEINSAIIINTDSEYKEFRNGRNLVSYQITVQLSQTKIRK